MIDTWACGLSSVQACGIICAPDTTWGAIMREEELAWASSYHKLVHSIRYRHGAKQNSPLRCFEPV
jgi:hypothetical protein